MFDKANFMEIGGETSSGGEKPQVEGRNLKWRGETLTNPSPKLKTNH